MQSHKFVTSVTWIKRGVCQENVESSEDAHEEELDDLKDEDDDDDMEDDDEIEEDDGNAEHSSSSPDNADEDVAAVDDDDEFDFKNYDIEDDAPDGTGFDDLVCFPSNDLDPYMALADDEDMSDIEDMRIKPDDNVIAVANVTKDSSTLDFYVYNEAQDDCFIHHSIPLVTKPICSEWVGYRPDTSGPGNYLAVGNLTPKIEFWAVDDVDSLEPAFSLGSIKKKKSQTSRTEGHSDAVLDIAWNSSVGNVVASGSADSTVLLWDILTGNVVATMSRFKDKVQSLQWHPFEPNNLLSGSCDKKARVFDCRNPKRASREWLCEGEVERVLWNHFDPFYCLASTDSGMVYCFDARAKASVWTLSAHPSAAVTGLSLSSSCPGCLMTASVDEHLKVWDIMDNKPSFVYDEKLKVKKIFSASTSPDSPFTICCGGDNKNHNLRVVDLSQVDEVMKKFRARPLVCVDRSTAFDSEKTVTSSDSVAKASNLKSKAKKKKKKQKSNSQ